MNLFSSSHPHIFSLSFSDGTVSQFVFLPTFGAGCESFVVEMKSNSVFRNPANLDRRIADNEGIGINGFGYNSASSHKSIFADIVSTDNGRICSDGCSKLYSSTGIFSTSVHTGAWVDDIGEYTGRPQEYIVLTDYTRVK